MAETPPLVVSNYGFFGTDGEPVSFAYLPLKLGDAEISSNDNKAEIYLIGTTDNGHRSLHKQVKLWKYKFLKDKPEISVLSKENEWIILQKPLKSYKDEIRTVLITVQCLQFFKRKPKASRESLRDHLFKVFSSYEIWPSEYDIIPHLDFISQVVKTDKTLGKSKYLASLLEGKSRKHYKKNCL